MTTRGKRAFKRVGLLVMEVLKSCKSRSVADEDITHSNTIRNFRLPAMINLCLSVPSSVKRRNLPRTKPFQRPSK